MKCFYDTYFLKLRTCYKNSENPTCIDLMLTDAPLIIFALVAVWRLSVLWERSFKFPIKSNFLKAILEFLKQKF